jgi:tRNA G18 (ribose-2'-O)-methylase SpoU
LSQIQFVTVLDNVRSLHNVGAIFRTADAAGVGKLYLCGMTGTPPRNEIRKAGLGAEEHVAWEYFQKTNEAIDKLKKEGYFILALENTATSVDYRHATYQFPLALVVGHEYHGIAAEILARCDAAISLPMRGVKSSLNVAVAFGIAAYEIASRLEAMPGEGS